jgi:hypothetical protein
VSNVDPILRSLLDLQGATRRLVVGRAVPVVDAVSECRGAVFGHVRIAAQYMLLGTLWAAWIGPAGGRAELWWSGYLVLTCEEGLEAPINIIVQINVFANVEETKERNSEEKGEVGSLPRDNETGRF